jgi:hypothetical protein
MKVAITCDYILGRNHYSEIVETICELFPESRIYTFAHDAGSILGRIEQRRITSTHLSNEVKDEITFYNHSSQIPLLAKNLFVSCEYDLIINISRGLSHGLKKCEKSKQLTYLYDIGFEGKVKKSFIQKLAYPWFLNFFVNSFKQADTVWVSRQDLHDDLYKYIGEAEVVPPPFKISDYALFPKEMFKHHFYLVETKGLDAGNAKKLIDFFMATNRQLQFIGDDSHLEELKTKYIEQPQMFFGIRCSGEHAPVMASSKMFISFNEIDFPKNALGTLATGRPILIPTSLTTWVKGEGVYALNEFDIDKLSSTLNEFEKIEETFDGKKLRGLVSNYNEIKFKAHLKRHIEKNFGIII